LQHVDQLEMQNRQISSMGLLRSCGRIVGMQKFTRSPVVVVAVAMATAILLIALAAFKPGDLTRVAIPGVLTGVGTLALAALTYALIRREDDDRRSTAEALRHSNTLALQASLQRRDQRSRVLLIEMRGIPEVRRPRHIGDNDPPPMPTGSQVSRGDRGWDRLIVRQWMWVRALDGQPITVNPNGMKPLTLEPGSGGDVVVPAEGSMFCFDIERSLDEWEAIRIARAKGQPGDEGVAELIVSDPYDDGVNDNYPLRQGGRAHRS